MAETDPYAGSVGGKPHEEYLSGLAVLALGRHGRKRALIAVGHSILVIFYHMLKHGIAYTDLGADFLDRLQPERLCEVPGTPWS